jgi:hypothetical protein
MLLYLFDIKQLFGDIETARLFFLKLVLLFNWKGFKVTQSVEQSFVQIKSSVQILN